VEGFSERKRRTRKGEWNEKERDELNWRVVGIQWLN
jgi:hypothetical protein